MIMTTREQREILEAYERGEKIEIRYKEAFNSTMWFTIRGEYCFDFVHNEYRIKKKWRAKPGCPYYYIDIYGNVGSFSEIDDYVDAQLHKVGNYF